MAFFFQTGGEDPKPGGYNVRERRYQRDLHLGVPVNLHCVGAAWSFVSFQAVRRKHLPARHSGVGPLLS